MAARHTANDQLSPSSRPGHPRHEADHTLIWTHSQPPYLCAGVAGLAGRSPPAPPRSEPSHEIQTTKIPAHHDQIDLLGCPTDDRNDHGARRADRRLGADSALCLPLRVVLVEGRDEGKPGGLHDIRGRRPDRNPAARQLHIEFDLSDRLAARAD